LFTKVERITNKETVKMILEKAIKKHQGLTLDWYDVWNERGQRIVDLGLTLVGTPELAGRIIFLTFTRILPTPGTSFGDKLASAAWDNKIKVVESLLREPGANVNQVNDRGQTALYCAARQGHGGVVTTLLKQATINVDVQVPGHEDTPLIAGAPHGEITAMLLARGASLEIKNKRGLTGQRAMTAQSIPASKAFETGGRDALIKMFDSVSKIPALDYHCHAHSNKKWRRARVAIDGPSLDIYLETEDNVKQPIEKFKIRDIYIISEDGEKHSDIKPTVEHLLVHVAICESGTHKPKCVISMDIGEFLRLKYDLTKLQQRDASIQSGNFVVVSVLAGQLFCGLGEKHPGQFFTSICLLNDKGVLEGSERIIT